MALYTSAIVWEKACDVCQISQTEQKDGFTSYIIDVRISNYKWKVSRRYKLFVDLHERMVKEYAVDKSLLPPKKIFGNKSETFINERKKALEYYLQSVIRLFPILPEPLALFLDFQKYEVRTITAILSETFFSTGEEILLSCSPYEFTPLQLHAISERVKLGDPCNSKNPRQDIAHLVDFISQLKHLIIVGSSQNYESSNIIPNELSYDLSLFKSAVTLEVYNSNLVKTLTSTDILRTNLKSLIIHKTLEDISEILLCGILHWCPITDPHHTWPFWNSISLLNLSHNKLTKIHSSIKLLSSVKHIDLSHNEIQSIEHMETLSELSVLNLSHNKIQDIDSLHTRLGNIHSLNLSSNKIKSLQGFSRLFSISELHLEYNQISSLAEVQHISKLPCVEILNLQHNPVTLCVDYRPQVLLLFGSLAPELTLDGLKATEKEIDTVSILQALKQARGETSSVINQSFSAGELNPNFSNSTIRRIQKHQEQNSPGENPSIKIMNNVNQCSKFRQQVETLRKIGGSDWLRLLNEIHNTKVNSDLTSDCKLEIPIPQNGDVLKNDGACINDNDSRATTTHLGETLPKNSGISYPDWLLHLDASALQIEQISNHKFFENCEKANKYLYGDHTSTSKFFWVVQLGHKENLVYEAPICILIRHEEIVFLELKRISKQYSSVENKCDAELTPEFLVARSVLPQNIISLNIGPCDAYSELRIKNNQNTENIFLMMDVDTTATFVSECYNLYNIMPLYKLNPFARKMLELETMTVSFSLAEVSVQKQILFEQRVCISNALHKCKDGILHYVFITPSHVILVEEKLSIRPYLGQDGYASTSQPQFQVCSIVNVHSNVKQIHLDYIDKSNDFCDNYLSVTKGSNSHVFNKIENFDILYKCGFWLLIEFDSNSFLHLNFFSLKSRNQFLDTFLSVRNQK